MALESEIEPSRYYYKVFTHLWNPPLLEETRLLVISEAPMTSDEVRAALVRSGMNRDPESGDLYIFRNRRGDMVKALFCDRHGLCMLAKRLSKGTFRIDIGDVNAMSAVQISAEELSALLAELALVRSTVPRLELNR